MARTLIVLLSAVIAIALVGAASAQTSAVSPQHVQRGGTYPVDVPGQHPPARAGKAMPRGRRLVSRRVTLSHGLTVRFALTCPRATTDRGVAIGRSTQIEFAVTDTNHYLGRRRVAIRAFSRVAAGPPGHATIYELCG